MLDKIRRAKLRYKILSLFLFAVIIAVLVLCMTDRTSHLKKKNNGFVGRFEVTYSITGRLKKITYTDSVKLRRLFATQEEGDKWCEKIKKKMRRNSGKYLISTEKTYNHKNREIKSKYVFDATKISKAEAKKRFLLDELTIDDFKLKYENVGYKEIT